VSSRSTTDAQKAEQRAAAKRAAEQRATARKRKDQLGVAAMVVAGIASVALIVGVAVFFNGRDNGKDTLSSANPSASEPAQQPGEQPPAEEPPAEEPPGEFPPLPEGADPALKEAPEVTASAAEAPKKLVVKRLITGKGAAVKQGQTISVNYTGVAFKTGEQFDSSWTRKQPFETAIGVGGVIPGWDQGLIGVEVGSRVQLDIPAEMAYGEKPERPDAPAGALRFVVDVLAAK
jgi:peptidylprolyl isomerase